MKSLKKIFAHILIALILAPIKGMSASQDNYEQNSQISISTSPCTGVTGQTDRYLNATGLGRHAVCLHELGI